MDLSKLLSMQNILNERIYQEHNISDPSNVFAEQILSITTELGELANIEKSFKYWSKKKSTATREELLDEYVDVLHFILTLGLTLNIHKHDTKMLETSIRSVRDEILAERKRTTLTEQFLIVKKQALLLHDRQTLSDYIRLFANFRILGEELTFQSHEIEQAYLKKNEINHQRLDSGY